MLLPWHIGTRSPSSVKKMIEGLFGRSCLFPAGAKPRTPIELFSFVCFLTLAVAMTRRLLSLGLSQVPHYMFY